MDATVKKEVRIKALEMLDFLYKKLSELDSESDRINRASYRTNEQIIEIVKLLVEGHYVYLANIIGFYQLDDNDVSLGLKK